MQTEKVKIEGVEYTIQELDLETGFQVMAEDGSLDIPNLIMASVLVNGKKPEPKSIPFRHGNQLLGPVLKLNGMKPVDDEGNG